MSGFLSGSLSLTWGWCVMTFEMKRRMVSEPKSPFDSVEYSDDIEKDALAEWAALLETFRSREPEHLLVLVWPSRDGADEFLDAWRLSRKEKFYPERQLRVKLKARPQRSFKMGDGFATGGGFEMKPSGKQSEVNADQGWVDRAKAESARFKKATDSEYWVAGVFDSADRLERFLEDFGLSEVPELPGYGHRLSGPTVSRLLEERNR